MKYFNTLDAWRIEKMGQGGGIPAAGPSDMSLDAQPSAESSASAEEKDDLPF